MIKDQSGVQSAVKNLTGLMKGRKVNNMYIIKTDNGKEYFSNLRSVTTHFRKTCTNKKTILDSKTRKILVIAYKLPDGSIFKSCYY